MGNYCQCRQEGARYTVSILGPLGAKDSYIGLDRASILVSSISRASICVSCSSSGANFELLWGWGVCL